jgi:hypothetical protein
MTDKYQQAFDDALYMMLMTDIEPKSALKQCASDHGIPYGEEMGKFVEEHLIILKVGDL